MQMVEESNMLMHDGMVVSQSVIWLEIGDDNSGVFFFCFLFFFCSSRCYELIDVTGSMCIRKLAAVCREGYRFRFYQLQLVMGL